MIHVILSKTHRAVDLELEVHAKMAKELFVEYVVKWVECIPIQSKTGMVFHVAEYETTDFADKILKSSVFRKFVLRFYGERSWKRIERILQCHRKRWLQYPA
jgi:hypothetical protein